MAAATQKVRSLSVAFWASIITAVRATMNFTMYTFPVKLRYGEVYNTYQFEENSDHTKFPQDVIARYAAGDKDMVITGFDMDMVRKFANGSEAPVKLSDHYLHHYILYFGQTKALRQLLNASNEDKHLKHALTGCHGMQGKGLRMYQDLGGPGNLDFVAFGSAAGAEYRHNPQRFKSPYGLILKRPEAWAPTLHIINTNLADNSSNSGSPEVSKLLECPCTPQRKIDVASGTIDGHEPEPRFGCSREFAATGNPSCQLSTYVGGWRCCEHGVFLIDTDGCKLPKCAEKHVDEVYMKFTFYYEDAQAGSRQMESAACCDVTSDGMGDGNIEYDVPACKPGTPPEQCVHVVETVQPLGYYRSFPFGRGPHGRDLVDITFAAPHLHWAGLSLTLIDYETNKTICEAHRSSDNNGGVMYGHGSSAGDENGYLVGLKPCSFDGSSSPRFRRDRKMLARAVYNATTSHTGVMSLWLMQVSAVPDAVVV